MHMHIMSEVCMWRGVYKIVPYTSKQVCSGEIYYQISPNAVPSLCVFSPATYCSINTGAAGSSGGGDWVSGEGAGGGAVPTRKRSEADEDSVPAGEEGL